MSIKIAMIDDVQVGMDINVACLKKEGAVIEGDVIDLYLSPELFMEAFAKKGPAYYDVLFCDHDFGVGAIEGYKFVGELQMKGLKAHAVLLTADDSMAMELRMHLTLGVEYIVKNSTKDGKSYVDQLSEVIERIRNKMLE